MRILRTKRRPSSYKSSSSYVEAIYKANKSLIDKKIETDDPSYNFKNLIIEKLNLYEGDNPQQLTPKEMRKVFNAISKKDIKKAVKDLSLSDAFTDYNERQQMSVYSAIRQEKEVFKQFRKATGWKKKVLIENFEWDKEERLYKYEFEKKGIKQVAYIDLKGSPKNSIYIMQFNTTTREYDKTIIAEWTSDRNASWKDKL